MEKYKLFSFADILSRISLHNEFLVNVGSYGSIVWYRQNVIQKIIKKRLFLSAHKENCAHTKHGLMQDLRFDYDLI